MNVAYAYAVDVLNWEQREAFDAQLNAPGADPPAKKRDQAAAQRELMAAMGRARG